MWLTCRGAGLMFRPGTEPTQWPLAVAWVGPLGRPHCSQNLLVQLGLESITRRALGSRTKSKLPARTREASPHPTRPTARRPPCSWWLLGTSRSEQVNEWRVWSSAISST